MSEASLNKQVIKYINSLNQSYAEKCKAGPSNPGALDVTGCIDGIRIELEGKVGDNKPTPLQLATIARWRSAGAITGWYKSFEEAVEIIASGIIRHRYRQKHPNF